MAVGESDDDRVARQLRQDRRAELLDTLREAAALRARISPRAAALARARALMRARTTRG